MIARPQITVLQWQNYIIEQAIQVLKFLAIQEKLFRWERLMKIRCHYMNYQATLLKLERHIIGR